MRAVDVSVGSTLLSSSDRQRTACPQLLDTCCLVTALGSEKTMSVYGQKELSLPNYLVHFYFL